MPSNLPVLPAIDHYSVVDQESCGCDLCMEWVVRRRELDEAMGLVPTGHKWSTCGCRVCRFVSRVHQGFMATSNMVDLISEMSFYASLHSSHGAKVMDWIEREIQSPVYTLNWKAREANKFSMDWWIRKGETTLGPLVSGKVFQLA